MAKPKNPVKGYEKFFNAFFDRNLKKISKALQGAGGLISEFVIPGSSNYFKALKTVELVVDHIVEIKDVNKAFYYAIAYSTANTFFKGMAVYDLELKHDALRIVQFRKSILDSFDKENYKAENFDVSRFNADLTVIKIKTRFLEWAKTNDIDELHLQRLEKYFSRYHEVDFFEVLESSKTKFARLTEFLKNESYQKRIKLLRRVKYENELAEQYLENVLGDEYEVKLNQIYIEPDFKVHHRSIKKDILENQHLNKDQSGFLNKKFDLNIHECINQLLLKKKPLKLDKQNIRMVFLLGYPGQGKTSFCKRLMYDIVQEQNPPISQKLYFVRLKNILDTNDLVNNPLDTLRYYLENEIDEDIPRREFHKSLLILDGLDELKMNAALTDQQVDDFCRRLIDETEAKEKSNLRIIMTSRYGYIKLDDLPKASDCPHTITLQLDNFDLTQQKAWLNKYQKFNQSTKLKETVLDEFNQKDDDYKAIRELLGQPILLKIIATLEQPLDKKDTKTKIYEKLFDQLIKRRYAGGKQIKALEGVTELDLRRVIQDIALEIFQSPYEYVHYQRLRAMTEEWGIDNFEESIKNLMISFYFREKPRSSEDDDLKNKNNYAIEFLHKSLQEYMTAEKIWREVQELPYKRDIFFSELFKLFSPKLLSTEILQDLIEIIRRSDRNIRKKTASKFKKFLPELLRHDFLYRYNSDNVFMNNPIEQSRNTFYSFWMILVSLEVEIDYLVDVTDSLKQKFITLLRYYIKDLPLLDLSFQTLISDTLIGQNFENVILLGVNFNYFDLSHVNLTHRELNKTNFNYTKLNGANLVRSNLSYVHLVKTNFSYSNLENANLMHASLEEVDLTGANLKGGNFTRTNLRRCRLNESCCDLVKLNMTDLTDSHMQNVSLKEAFLIETNFENTSLNKSNLCRAKFLGVNLEGVDLTNVNFYRASLIKVNLVRSNASHANLNYAYLRKCDFSFSNLTRVNFSNASLNKTSFNKSILTYTDFKNSIIPEISFFRDAKFNKYTQIAGAYTQDLDWLNKFEETIENDLINPFNIHLYELSDAISSLQILKTPNLYLKSLSLNQKPIYQIRLKPGQIE